MGWWCVILPLILALILSLIWTSTYSKHNSIRASVKSWYLVGTARTKSILKNIEGKNEQRESKEKDTFAILPKLIPKVDKSEKSDTKTTVAESTK